MTSDLREVLSLKEGEKTVIHLPDRDITYHWIRRAEDGFETKTALTPEWREISEGELREELDGPKDLIIHAD